VSARRSAGARGMGTTSAANELTHGLQAAAMARRPRRAGKADAELAGSGGGAQAERLPRVRAQGGERGV
jgi:hypothetical protein